MAGAHPSPETLQHYFDAELAPAESADARAHIATCQPCAAQLASLERLGRMLQMAAADSAEQVDFDAMFANIERGIATDPQPATKPAPVSSPVGASRRPIVSPVGASRRPIVSPVGASRRPIVDLMSQRMRRLSNAGPALGALALAAAVLLMVYRPDVSQSPGNDEPYEVSASNAPSEVVEVDFGANAGTVFDILLSDGSSNPVVWIDDDEEEDEPENEPGE